MSNVVSQFQTIHPTDLHWRCNTLDFDILRVPYALPMAALNQALANVKRDYPWSGKDGAELYQAIGLQYSAQAGTSNSVFLDAVDRKATYGFGEGYHQTYDSSTVKVSNLHAPFRFYDRINVAGDQFDFVYQRVHPLRLYRTRLMLIQPGFELGHSHIDGPRSIRLHIPIETNPEAWFEISGRRYHLPADGSAYLVNTSRPHRIGNAGAIPRTHFVAVLYQRSAGPLHDLAIHCLRDFFEANHGVDGAKVAELKAECQKLSNHSCEICGTMNTRLYEIPSKGNKDPVDLLRSACSTCIETVCRPIASRFGTEGEALDEFKYAIAHACRTR